MKICEVTKSGPFHAQETGIKQDAERLKRKRADLATKKAQSKLVQVVCPANFVPVAMIGTGSKGAVYGTREEAWSRTGGEPVAAD
jgi:hypothetical protein